MDDLHKLSIDDYWFSSEECEKLTEYAKDLLKKDDLNPCDIEVINNNIPSLVALGLASLPDEYQEEFWEKIMEYFDML
jgi:hypothetical protein